MLRTCSGGELFLMFWHSIHTCGGHGYQLQVTNHEYNYEGICCVLISPPFYSLPPSLRLSLSLLTFPFYIPPLIPLSFLPLPLSFPSFSLFSFLPLPLSLPSFLSSTSHFLFPFLSPSSYFLFFYRPFLLFLTTSSSPPSPFIVVARLVALVQ